MTVKQHRRSVGFIGLGNMGLPMATRLLNAGYTVAGFDLSADAQEAFAQAGGTVASQPADVASSEILILMLPNSSIVRSVITDAEMLSALRPNTVVVDMSSSEPLATRALAHELHGDGFQLIDAPVSGGVKGAVNGTLTIMVGGPEESFAFVREALEELGRTHHVGEVGAGHALKALNNLLSATHLWVTSEAMVVGQRFGLDPSTMLAIFNASSGVSGSTQNKWPNFIIPETYNSGFALQLMLKDMKIATGLANQLGASMSLGEGAVELWDQAALALPDTADHTEVARWLSS